MRDTFPLKGKAKKRRSSSLALGADAQIFDFCRQEDVSLRFTPGADARIFDFCKQGVKNLNS